MYNLINSINQAKSNMGIEEELLLVKADAITWLEKVNLDKFDLIYLDPPYQTNMLIQAVRIIGREFSSGLVFLEHDKEFASFLPENWELIKEGSAGEVFYGLCLVHSDTE